MTIFTSSQTIARRFTQAAVDERKEDAMRFFCVSLEMIEQGLDLGVDRSFLLDTARGLHDALSDLNHAMARDLDDVGLEVLDERIDLSDLRQVISGLTT